VRIYGGQYTNAGNCSHAPGFTEAFGDRGCSLKIPPACPVGVLCSLLPGSLRRLNRYHLLVRLEKPARHPTVVVGNLRGNTTTTDETVLRFGHVR